MGTPRRAKIRDPTLERTMLKHVFSAAALALAMLLASTSPARAEPPIQLGQGWARPTVEGQMAGGAFLRIANRGGADRLLSASSPAATSVELHSMAMDGEVMKMRPVEAIEVPAGKTVELKPGGLHLMLVGLKAPLKVGASLPLTLKFEKAGELSLAVPVAQQAPAK
jgi:copper(I)-binding protein